MREGPLANSPDADPEQDAVAHAPASSHHARYIVGLFVGLQPRGRLMDSPAVRAPDFSDTLDWIHTGGRPLALADFRGKLLLLDFWTYG
jgi:hypothetical protein